MEKGIKQIKYITAIMAGLFAGSNAIPAQADGALERYDLLNAVRKSILDEVNKKAKEGSISLQLRSDKIYPNSKLSDLLKILTAASGSKYCVLTTIKATKPTSDSRPNIEVFRRMQEDVTKKAIETKMALGYGPTQEDIKSGLTPVWAVRTDCIEDNGQQITNKKSAVIIDEKVLIK